ncbi:nitroreductase/quinone reductase family protein [Sphingobium sp.]|uniref:nitroreductase/quinone reductase family protein n=1 Tax=Sphingobium sp. TaxID=1912891 RepID=UPI0028BD5F92|nr:nitroreductase/quinone reductase family protein [Sphingobium sp.]
MSVPTFSDIPTDINRLIAEHIKLYLTDPAAAHMWDARPVGLPGEVTTLLLTTIGRKSGEPRHVPLLYVEDGDGYLIMGSKGGNADHPLWFLNLQADPVCEARVGAPPVKARARILEGDEYARAWSKVAERHATYAKYQARTERRIPIVRIEPIAAG